MGDVIAFQKEKVRKTTLRGEARKLLTTCLNSVRKPVGLVIITVGLKGEMHLEFIAEPELMPLDLLARAEAMAHAEKNDFLQPRAIEDEEEVGE